MTRSTIAGVARIVYRSFLTKFELLAVSNRDHHVFSSNRISRLLKELRTR